ncbi:hypothetical protein K504DRAFT_235639 [Pleomassaria siparia CBS 279.74]|uniref:Uncharacterized protein n=1 Tax=Pleomassaria siparia CBS 279.74 TaxID=1314801 RepID=A0A6G1KE68_9PLEO|nr:hypothetical protein K504DRAFT_235639 [Pleomassaria siparia CBS 279.74]
MRQTRVPSSTPLLEKLTPHLLRSSITLDFDALLRYFRTPLSLTIDTHPFTRRHSIRPGPQCNAPSAAASPVRGPFHAARAGTSVVQPATPEHFFTRCPSVCATWLRYAIAAPIPSHCHNHHHHHHHYHTPKFPTRACPPLKLGAPTVPSPCTTVPVGGPRLEHDLVTLPKIMTAWGLIPMRLRLCVCVCVCVRA